MQAWTAKLQAAIRASAQRKHEAARLEADGALLPRGQRPEPNGWLPLTEP